MQNDQKSNRRRRQNRSVVSSGARSQRGTSNAVRHESKGSLNAQRNYEQYLALCPRSSSSRRYNRGRDILSVRRTLF